MSEPVLVSVVVTGSADAPSTSGQVVESIAIAGMAVQAVDAGTVLLAPRVDGSASQS